MESRARQELRQTIVDARQRFIRDIEEIVRHADTETKTLAAALSNAIGEISVEEAIETLERFIAERKRR